MRLGLGFALLALLLVVVAVVAWAEGAQRADANWETARFSAWKMLLEANVRVGEPGLDAEAWLRAVAPAGTSVRDFAEGQSHTLSLLVESAKATGPAFPCSAPDYVLSVSIGPDGKVTGRELRDDRACL